ncbi:prephenate dehydrogenase [Caulobacter sp. S45]|uniref:prephenate dehydrogenase n=1 Tax=Caulobacter sp. S45 TaxID=1641861 RepID=UPI00131A9099|nr:prephenate dehydrogenase [Caulobacter sp. S45]
MALDQDTPPTIGLIGFGAFGRLMARHLRPWFPMRAFDPSLVAGDTVEGVEIADLASTAACDIVVLAVPVDQLAAAIAQAGPYMRSGALVLDVGSVKSRPARILREQLPEHVDIVGTHPLFGPQSARNGVEGLKIAVCPIRGGQTPRVAAFLRKRLKLRVIVTTPEAHDQEAAVVQGLTHLIAKVLVQMEPLPTRMTTASFDMLMRAVDMVRHDPPSVFLAIEQANPYAEAVRERFFGLAEQLHASLEKGEA